MAWTIGRTAKGKMQSAIRLTMNDSGAIERMTPALTRAAIWRRSVPSTRGPSCCGVSRLRRRSAAPRAPDGA